MLEHHFRSFKTIDRYTALWLGPQIVRHVQWLEEQHASHQTVRQHVRMLAHFNDFVLTRGVTQLQDLPNHVDAFVEQSKAKHVGANKKERYIATIAAQTRSPVEQMLCVVLPSYTRPGNQLALPFALSAPGLFTFLQNEKGLRPSTLDHYSSWLRLFEAYLARADIVLAELTPACITEFLTERAKTLHKDAMVAGTSALRVFLRYLHREGIVATDLGNSVPRGRVYQQASLPRAISWNEVEGLLARVDQRSDQGKRDYAILVLLASYGLRAREVAALCLDDFDWKHAQLNIPMRKGGHSTRYPLSETAGEAVIRYLKVRRTDVAHRQVFLTTKMPFAPMKHWAISRMVSSRMHNANIQVRRAGSHTLRHACVQHLVEADVPFKIIGDYVGHHHPASTLVYGKVAVHKLRELVILDAEDVL